MNLYLDLSLPTKVIAAQLVWRALGFAVRTLERTQEAIDEHVIRCPFHADGGTGNRCILPRGHCGQQHLCYCRTKGGGWV
ncbi:MAG: hypothetical protein HOW73_43335 [Polyangiaceae bacterium]|nr:hypothetical protein [Polyangiaceae bacterium]